MSALAHFVPVAEPDTSDKLTACNAWVDHARPIIRAMLMLDDEVDGVLLRACIDADKGRRWSDPRSWQAKDYDYARADVRKAYDALYGMLDGIRNNFLSDQSIGAVDPDEGETLYDVLNRETIGVDAAINAVAEARS